MFSTVSGARRDGSIDVKEKITRAKKNFDKQKFSRFYEIFKATKIGSENNT